MTAIGGSWSNGLAGVRGRVTLTRHHAQSPWRNRVRSHELAATVGTVPFGRSWS